MSCSSFMSGCHLGVNLVGIFYHACAIIEPFTGTPSPLAPTASFEQPSLPGRLFRKGLKIKEHIIPHWKGRFCLVP